MRILLLHQYFLEEDDPGGSRWNEISKTWKENGHEVEVIAGMMHANGLEKRPEYKGKFFVKNKQGDTIVYRAHVSETYNSGFLGRLWGYFSFMFSSLWVGIFKAKGKYDAIVVTSPPLFVGVSGFLISIFKRIPMVFEVRDLWPESAIDTGVLTNKWIIKLSYAVEKFIYNKSKLINVLTPAFYKTLKNKKKISEDKLLMIPNAADFALSDKILNNFDRDSFRENHDLTDKFVITYVGAHGVANHLQQLLETAEIMKDTNVLFQLIGNGMEKEKLKDLAKKMNLPNVKFVDSVPKTEVFKYILASEMGASVLKKVDTFKTIYSNKTFDYFSCKRPVLMAIDGVSRELIEEAEAGVYAEPENPNAIREAILNYLINPDLIKIHGENGYNYAKENFDRNKLAIKYINSIEKVI